MTKREILPHGGGASGRLEAEKRKGFSGPGQRSLELHAICHQICHVA